MRRLVLGEPGAPTLLSDNGRQYSKFSFLTLNTILKPLALMSVPNTVVKVSFPDTNPYPRSSDLVVELIR